MNLSPRLKVLIFIGGGVLIIVGWVSLILGLGNNGDSTDSDDFAANIQQAIPEPNNDITPQVDNNPTQTNSVEQTTQQISVVVPPIMSKEQRKSIHAMVDREAQQQTKLLYYPTWGLYEKVVQRALSENNRHDIVLLPSPRFQSFENKVLQFRGDQYVGLFHPMMQSWFFNPTIGITPFSIDPYVIVGRGTNTQYESTATIISERNTDESSYNFSPWLVTGKKTVAQFGAEILLNQGLINAANSGAKRWASFLLLPSLLTTSNYEVCNGLLSWCAFEAGDNRSTIQLLSQVGKIDQETAVYPLPIESVSYPIIGRGFVIPSTSDNQSAAGQRMMSYLEASKKGSLPYPEHVFSASLRTLQRQRIEQQYSLIQRFFDAPAVIDGSFEARTFFSGEPIQSFINGSRSLDQLLQAIGDLL